MYRFLLCAFAMSFFLGFCNLAEAKLSPVQPGTTSSINTGSQTSQQTNQCHNSSRPCPGKQTQRQRIPKPERNRLCEGGKSSRTRKKKEKHKSNKTKRARKKSVGKLSLSEQTQNIANAGKKRKKKQLNVITESVNDIPLLIKSMSKMGIQEAIDQHVTVQKNQRDLSWGWTAVIWLSYMLSEGDHRKVAVREYISGMRHALSELTGMTIDEKDFTDDRLTILCKYLSDNDVWENIEEKIGKDSIEAYELPQETARVDATTVSGYHETVEGGLFQFGNSKDDPDRPQIKIMTGSIDPLAMPLATNVVPGQRADDGLYIPIIRRMASIIQKKGILYIGDCKLSSIENRIHIKAKEKSYYLCPLPNTGKTSEQMVQWINEGNVKDDENELIKYIIKNDKGEEELKAKGYEIEREQSGKTEDGKKIKWTERVLIVKSPAYEKQKIRGLEKRLESAEKKIMALTPPRGPGKRQITDEKKLMESAELILKKHRVKDFLTYDYVLEIEKKTKYVGRGRGGKNRDTKIEEKRRYQIIKTIRNQEEIESEKKKYGWKAYVTNASKCRLDFIDVVKSYRKQYRVEQIFKILKSRLNIAPFYVKRKDQIKGITHLLTIGVKVLSLIEFVVRRSLAESDEKLVGLHLENPGKATNTPTYTRILNAFSKVRLTIIESEDSVIRHLTPLSKLQSDILKHLGFSTSIYD